jgi:hypothetical protein
METTRSYWPRWAETLRRYQLDSLAVSLLEAVGPLFLLGAQALYLVSPFWGGDQANALARMLESDDEAHQFAAFLAAAEGKS